MARPFEPAPAALPKNKQWRSSVDPVYSSTLGCDSDSDSDSHSDSDEDSDSDSDDDCERPTPVRRVM